MGRKICWKKGMRLTDDILTASDNSHIEFVNKAILLAAAGRCGLLAYNDTFQISASINKNIIDIESLNCLAITKDGSLIDIKYDTNFSNSFKTQTIIPDTEEKSLYIVVSIQHNIWKEIDDLYCEPYYYFEVISENSVLAPNSFPILHIVNEYGWRIDETDFIPPCLYISSHPMIKEYAKQFSNILKSTNIILKDSINSDCKLIISIFWPIVQNLKIAMDKDTDLMTPMMLLGNIQKLISGFLCACKLERNLNLSGEDDFENYINLPYNNKNVHARIKEGLILCLSIKEKIEKLKDFTTEIESIEAPTISKNNIIKKCTNSKVRIPIENNCPGATVYYTVDGSEPNNTSSSGNTIVISSGFVGGRDKEEKDKTIVVKIKAILNGKSSKTNTYNITLQKDVKHWIEI